MGFISKLLGFGKDIEKAKKALENGAMVIDVRSVAEFKQGHISDAMNIPLDNIPDNIQKIKEYNKPVVVCCASGGRSSTAAFLLSKYDIEVYDAGSWNNLK